MADTSFPFAPIGWPYDEETGTPAHGIIYRTGHRCRNWNCCGTDLAFLASAAPRIEPPSELASLGGYAGISESC